MFVLLLHHLPTYLSGLVDCFKKNLARHLHVKKLKTPTCTQSLSKVMLGTEKC